jgi:hypothetical protein
MEYVPGLSFIESQLSFAKARWGVPILRYPHPLFFADLKDGAYTLGHPNLPQFSTDDITNLAMKQCGATLVLLGHKKADGLWRRHQMAQQYKDARFAHIKFPIRDWKKLDTLAYIRGAGIPVPEACDDTSQSVNCSSKFVLWLYDNHPRDYQRFLEFFPFAAAIPARREHYGIAKSWRAKEKEAQNGQTA